MQDSPSLAVIGAGPAGLIAAQTIAETGRNVIVYDRMASAGRKFLMAGRGGLNLTHSEDLQKFIPRYGCAAERLAPVIRRFTPDMLRTWAETLGQSTFIGSSGRVFPKELKTSPLLRAWLRQLDKLGVRFEMRRQWMGWNDRDQLIFNGPNGKVSSIKPAATLLALGGASWPRLGSDGGWVPLVAKHNITVTPLRPANCGFAIAWSDHLRQRMAGKPLKPVSLTFANHTIRGEAMITDKGIEGGAVYALSSVLREAIAKEGSATLLFDLCPDLSCDELAKRLQAPQGSQSRSNFLRKAVNLSPSAIALLSEALHGNSIAAESAASFAALIKSLPFELTAPFSIERAISTAGGIAFDALDENFMLRNKPGTFAAGEMLDWEAPTGGYLLQAAFSTGVAAAHGMLKWLA